MKGFNGDGILLARVRELIEEREIRSIVETGTRWGDTTRRLAESLLPTHSIEIREDFYLESAKNLGDLSNVTLHLGDSGKVLPRILAFLPPPTLFYLDAHWGYQFPLREELEGIKGRSSSVIVIHDFQVPLHPELGFDRIEETPIGIEMVRLGMDGVFGEGNWVLETNELAEGSRRGVGFFLPRKAL